ncbi:MAG: NADH-quinone oxidoreductase subunit N [Limisphaerales bacterium]
MNVGLLGFEYGVLILAILLLLIDLFASDRSKSIVPGFSVLGLIAILAWTFHDENLGTAFGGAYVQDALALWFKRFFLIAAILVQVISIEYSRHIKSGLSEYFVLQLFALLGMMFAASAKHFMLLFVALELMTVTFYILVAYLRHRLDSLEAGVKYLILAALSSGFLIYGIALVFGVSGTMDFVELKAVLAKQPTLAGNVVLQMGLLLIFLGLAFKLAAFPVQIWAPDVYQGAPTPTTAFLALGSKAAGVVLLMRLMGQAIPDVAANWKQLLMVVSALTILYGSLCALPQRNLKRLLGYSSIASGGFLLMGFAAASQAGSVAILYYLGGYLFTAAAAFTVIAVIVREAGLEDVNSLAGLNQRNPFLAGTLAMAVVSLAGIPPLAGFFGKFLLFKAVLEKGAEATGYYLLIVVAVVGVLISLYYYLNIIRAIYWSKDPTDLTPIEVSAPTFAVLSLCIGAILWLGIFPQNLLDFAARAISTLSF